MRCYNSKTFFPLDQQRGMKILQRISLPGFAPSVAATPLLTKTL
jgi:hypothetical protein